MWETSKPSEEMEKSIEQLLSKVSILCAYCEQENTHTEQECSFCKAPLTAKRPQITGNLSESDLLKTYTEYQQNYHIHDLLILLTNARKQKEKAYKDMRLIQKQISKEESQLAEEEYREWKQRVTLISNIIEDKLGYKVLRVTDKLLEDIKKRTNLKP